MKWMRALLDGVVIAIIVSFLLILGVAWGLLIVRIGCFIVERAS